MKKYLFFCFLCLFTCCLGIVFAEENLIAQMTAIRVGNLTFQLPAGFVKDNIIGYRRQLGEYKFDSIQIYSFPKTPNYSDEQLMASLKENSSVIGQSEEVNINGKKVLFINSSSGAYAYFCENELLYNIVYLNLSDDGDYNSAKSLLMNLIRTAR